MTGMNERPEGQVKDAAPGNWVDSYAPQAMRPYLRLSRMDRPAATWLLLAPCWWSVLLAAAADQFTRADLWFMIGCTIGAFLMRGAGCSWNDITDRHIDAEVDRTKSRPLPSGQLSLRQAYIWMVLQAAIALLVLLTFNWATILLGAAALIPVAIYPFAKRFTWWPQVFLGLAINWGALLGWVAHFGTLGWPPVLLYLAGVAWTLFYDTIYAHQDKEDDTLIGVKSTARLFGENTKPWLRGFMMATVLLMAGGIILAMTPGASILALAMALMAAWGLGWHLTWQLGRLDIDDPELCKRLFWSNRDAGFIPVLFFAVAAFV